MDTIEKRLQAVKSRIAAACAAAGRDPRDIVLVAVGKTFPADDLRAAHAAGQRDFGENQVQEALAKIERLRPLGLVWHFIGPVQSNKTRAVAEHFDWVHSIDRLKVAERLSVQRPEPLPPLQACVQVNVSGEASKSGVPPAEAPALARAVASLPRLRLRGLMTIPEPTTDVALARRRFETLRDLQGELVRGGLPLDTLSMGMSDDFEAAIAAGATMVRVGSAIFGPRRKAERAAVERR
ncbi:MAG TPA: YggS family pyridoxal phosphate-dependent enzyme [Burkholderiales bacterium]|nr:YggS family pyridoxal phosphate-dependent enzyme [Burkholderiales bacterium]